jgi:hypothetical protein
MEGENEVMNACWGLKLRGGAGSLGNSYGDISSSYQDKFSAELGKLKKSKSINKLGL